MSIQPPREWFAALGLSESKLDEILAYLCSDEVGLAETKDLLDLEPEDLEHLRSLLPKIGVKKFNRALSALAGGGELAVGGLAAAPGTPDPPPHLASFSSATPSSPGAPYVSPAGTTYSTGSLPPAWDAYLVVTPREEPKPPEAHEAYASDPDVARAVAGLTAAKESLAAASAGFEFKLQLASKMGMGVNPDGVVSKVVEGGQAEAGGVRPGCRILEANGAAAATLEELKTALAACKASGASECTLKFADPRQLARAASEVAGAKSALAAAVAEAAASQERAARMQAQFKARQVSVLTPSNT